MGEPEGPPRLDHDPAVYLDRARAAMDDLREMAENVVNVDHDILHDAVSQAQAWASMATAAAMLQPTPEEVIAVYQETHAEVMGEEAQKVARAIQILQEARETGPRHPAILRALEVLTDG